MTATLLAGLVAGGIIWGWSLARLKARWALQDPWELWIIALGLTVGGLTFGVALVIACSLPLAG